jgi:hypothetical protein
LELHAEGLIDITPKNETTTGKRTRQASPQKRYTNGEGVRTKGLIEFGGGGSKLIPYG